MDWSDDTSNRHKAHAILVSFCFCVCSIFVRGAGLIGPDSGASLFWDKYLEFELQQFSSAPVQAQLQLLPPPYTGTLIAGVYAQVLGLPLRDIEKFWTGFSQHFAVNYPLNYLATTKEAEEATNNYPKELPKERAAAGGDTAQALTAYLNEWELEQRRLLLAKREYTFRMSQQLRDEKYPYEHLLTRTYFHSAPLHPTELGAWNGLLDLMEGKLLRALQQVNHANVQQGKPQLEPKPENMDQLLLQDTIKSYERCLIPCAGVAEFWDRYSSFLVSIGLLSDAIAVRMRQLEFMRRNVLAGVSGAAASVQEACLALADLHEREGNIDEAREFMTRATTQTTESETPFLEAILAQIAMERRIWQTAHPDEKTLAEDSEVAKLFTQAKTKLTGIANARAFIYLAMQEIQFTLAHVSFASVDARVSKVRGLFDSACKVMFPSPVTSESVQLQADGSSLTTSVTNVPRIVASKQFLLFWLQWVDFEWNGARSSVAAVSEVFEHALTHRPGEYTPQIITTHPFLQQGGASGLSEASRRQLWTAYRAFVEEHASDIEQVDRVRQSARIAVASLPTSTGATPILSSLAKRKSASSPLPMQPNPAKMQRPIVPPQHHRFGGPQGYPPAPYGYGAPPTAGPTTGQEYYAGYYQQPYAQ